MKQYEAVIETLEKLGGVATLGQLYQEVLEIKECVWKTKTPFASIRRIVQTRPEIFKVKPGLWGLRARKSNLNYIEETKKNKNSQEIIEQNHTYYQGLLVSVGNLKAFATFVPNQDKNREFFGKKLKEIISIDKIPNFSYEQLVRRSQTIDVIWFNNRMMPDSFFEVEHSSDFQNSLLKFHDLQDFSTRKVIVASKSKRKEFEHKIYFTAFDAIRKKVDFLDYESLVSQYEQELAKHTMTLIL
jgi:hypothetical protein